MAGAIQRMATLAGGGGRITVELVEAEMAHLTALWRCGAMGGAASGSRVEAVLSAGRVKELDRFERVQLEDVLAACAGARTMSEAGRELFAASRRSKKVANDADRLRKYLARFGLTWEDVRA